MEDLADPVESQDMYFGDDWEELCDGGNYFPSRYYQGYIFYRF